MNLFLVRLMPPRADFAQTLTDDEQHTMDLHGTYWEQLRNGGHVVDQPVSPADLHATIYHHLGVDPELEYFDEFQRIPQRICEGRRVAWRPSSRPWYVSRPGFRPPSTIPSRIRIVISIMPSTVLSSERYGSPCPTPLDLGDTTPVWLSELGPGSRLARPR